MERHYSSSMRHELGSSHSALDGVPFKIGRAFCKPEQIIAPQLSSSRGLAVISQKYSFETEEAVLAWAQARNEAMKKVAVEQAQQLTSAEERKICLKEISSEGQPQNDVHSTSQDCSQEMNACDLPRQFVPIEEKATGQVKSHLPPEVTELSKKVSPEPGSVLTPIPIKRTYIPCARKEKGIPAEKNNRPDSQLDLAMFEAEADPFNSLELQTLDDIEELKHLLHSDSVNTDCEPCPVQEEILEENKPSLSVDSFGKTCERTALKQKELCGSFEDTIRDSRLQIKKNHQGAVFLDEAVEALSDDGNYVEIVRNYKKCPLLSPSEFIESDKSSCLLNSTCLKPNLDGAIAIKTQIYKPILPPISKPTQPLDNSLQHSKPTPISVQSQPIDPSLGVPSTQTFVSASLDAVKAPPGKPVQNRAVVSYSSSPYDSDFIQPSSPAPLPPMTPKPNFRSKPPASISSYNMSVSSGPSLALFLEDSISSDVDSLQISHSEPFNSTSDFNVDHTTKEPDIPRKNSSVINSELWTHLTPLPPMHSSTCNNNEPKCLPPQKQLGLSDPYISLSREEQSFTDSLANMGFLRPKVARAVQKFGPKEKEVLDHLLAVDKLGEQSYAPEMIESALFTFNNDMEKAEKFLRLHAQFEELGFQKDKIFDALVSTDLEYGKALDVLTA